MLSNCACTRATSLLLLVAVKVGGVYLLDQNRTVVTFYTRDRTRHVWWLPRIFSINIHGYVLFLYVCECVVDVSKMVRQMICPNIGVYTHTTQNMAMLTFDWFVESTVIYQLFHGVFGES